MSDTPTPNPAPDAAPQSTIDSGQFYQYQVPNLGTIITYAPPELVKKWGGIRSEAVVARAAPGIAFGRDTDWSLYQGSQPFRDLLQRLLSTEGHLMPEYRDAAKGRDEGFIVVVDLRSPNRNKPPVAPADMIGAFKVKNGVPIEGGYMPNPNYRTVSAAGPTLLPEALHKKVISALEALPQPTTFAA